MLVEKLSAPYHWLVNSEGSTRAMALMRVGIVINCWARWSDDHVLYRDIHPESLVMGSLFFLTSTLALIGLFTRWATAGLAVCSLYFVYVVGHMRGYEPYTHHHTTLLAWACLLIALAPAGRSLSVDRYLAVRRAEKAGSALPPEVGNLFAQRLIALQVASIYFWGAVDKCNWGFLSGARMTHYLQNYYIGPQEMVGRIPGIEPAMFVAAVATVLLEFGLAFGLFFQKGRRWLILPGLLLHGAFYFALSVFTFTTTMWVLYLAFLDPDELDGVLAKLVPHRAPN